MRSLVHKTLKRDKGLEVKFNCLFSAADFRPILKKTENGDF